jgi:cobalt/nickel transport system permease protein
VITALLAFAFVGSLLYGQIPSLYLPLLYAGLGIFLTIAGRYHQSPFIPIDILAQNSGLKKINPVLKFITLCALMVISIMSKNGMSGIFLLLVAGLIAIIVGGINLRQYIHVLALPVSFLLMGGLALLYEVSHQPMGVLNLNIFGRWFYISPEAQQRTALMVARASGALSCLCLLSLTTPMSDIIGVLRRLRCPALIIDLMYLIYRYIFILLSLFYKMRTAAQSRLGFKNYRIAMRSTGRIYAKLLARSYQFAGKNFDAMESRCYDTGIVFLERWNGISFPQGVSAAVIVLISLGLNFLPGW